MSAARIKSAMPRSDLYAGRVTHRRVRPRTHNLGYRVFNLLLDLDETDGLAKNLRLFSRDRFNVVSFYDRDHGDGSDTPLRTQVARMVERAGVTLDGGSIQILCLPRVFGYVFNPLSVYFCHDRDDCLACMVYEVSNTFGQRHSYVIPVERGRGGTSGTIHQTCAKAFYVSPFLDMDLTYKFEVRPPGERVDVTVMVHDAAGPVIATAFSGTRRTLTDATIVRAILAHPLLTLKVVVAIHWEALALWIKGIGLRPRPPAPAETFTTVVTDVD